MAGYIFSISSEEGIEGVKRCIHNGYYASIVPNEKLYNTKGKQIAAAVLADYASMKTGDNVYFLSKRQIYGVGKLVEINGDCKFKNYRDASCIEEKKDLKDEVVLVELEPKYRWICFFEPEQRFFSKGVDMDEVLMYKPDSFRVLRSFQDVTFIKIDDEENRALKECIYLKNKNLEEVFPFSDTVHRRIKKMELDDYFIDNSVFVNYITDDGELELEMMLEAALVNQINRDGFEGERYDYVSHQVIASPFKPLSYIDKMDIFAYRFLDNYPDQQKPIEKYLVIELKKGKANSDMALQLVRYVDWISKEYASGDYSKIRAVGIAKKYTRDIKDTLEKECVRSYLCDTHPNVTARWNDITMYEYSVEEDGSISLSEEDYTDWVSKTIDQFETIGFKTSKTVITIEGKQYKPSFKIPDLKVACFVELERDDKKVLEDKGWRILFIKDLNTEVDVKELIFQSLKR